MSILATLKERYSVKTDPLLSQRRIELLALALAGIFLLQIVYGAVRLVVHSLPDAHTVAPGSLRISKVEAQPRLSPELQSEIVSRPLFWASRRPTVAAQPTVEVAAGSAAAVSAKVSDLKKLKLLGTFGGKEAGGIIAMVNGKQQRILLDEKALDWTLAEIGPDRAVFRYAEQDQEVLLEHAPLPAGGGGVSAPKKSKNKDAKAKGANAGGKKAAAARKAEEDRNAIKSFTAPDKKKPKGAG